MRHGEIFATLRANYLSAEIAPEPINRRQSRFCRVVASAGRLRARDEELCRLKKADLKKVPT
jgi:hypothetical protein